ncbi:putative TIGR02452 family protein [Paratrimastix pyriformis]|uniref:TIGR02452 family protein n=1 Tax=Paratrimastix pyriformis TaxID=342808 RepID=A0ABQ8UDK7_9EUKA|nr:putative TIGR02452 family protein [Paratrimastix pyriformis]
MDSLQGLVDHVHELAHVQNPFATPWANHFLNAAQWLAVFRSFVDSNNEDGIRGMRRWSTLETVSIVRSWRNTDPIFRAINGTLTYSDPQRMPHVSRSLMCPVFVVSADSLDTGLHLAVRGHNPAVLNLASFLNPGGGYKRGDAAQEENLCRRSALWACIDQELSPSAKIRYPWPPMYSVYSPAVPVFRASEAQGFAAFDRPVAISFVSVAAVKNPPLTRDGRLEPFEHRLMSQKIHLAFQTALAHRHDVFVLGALGCGPPYFGALVFAILGRDNASIFAQAFDVSPCDLAALPAIPPARLPLVVAPPWELVIAVKMTQ